MKYYLSFTSVLKALHQHLTGEQEKPRRVSLSPEELFRNDAILVFGANRCHVLSQGRRSCAPFEVTWLNEERRSRYGMKEEHYCTFCERYHRDTGVILSKECEPQAIKTWETLHQIIMKKLVDGKVMFSEDWRKGTGNYHDFIKDKLKEGYEVWFDQWMTKNHYREFNQ